jgi:hypothetical protein
VIHPGATDRHGVGRAEIGELVEQVRVRADPVGGQPSHCHDRDHAINDVVGETSAIGIAARFGRVVLEHVGQQTRHEIAGLDLRIAHGPEGGDEPGTEAFTLVHRCRLVERRPIGVRPIEDGCDSGAPG